MENSTVKRILVIDSQPRTRSRYLEMLVKKGFDAVGAESSGAGIKAVNLKPPDLILCDENTETSGKCSLIEAVGMRLETLAIPIVLVLAALSRAALNKAALSGADAYLVQPLSAEALYQVISVQLAQRERLRQCYLQLSQPTRCLSEESWIAAETSSTESPLSQALQFISANHTQSIALSDVAQFVGYSPSYLTAQMRKETGQTVQQWIIQMRMATACALLLNTSRSVEDIATRTGYHSTTHFFRQFRQLYGTTPQAWRKQRCRA